MRAAPATETNGIPKTVDEYLATLPEVQRDELDRLRALVKSLVPESQETISTGVQALKYQGELVISFGAAKHHLSLFLVRGNVIQMLKEELKDHDTSNTVIRFTPQTPLPRALVAKIVRSRIAEIPGKKARTAVRAERRFLM